MSAALNCDALLSAPDCVNAFPSGSSGSRWRVVILAGKLRNGCTYKVQRLALSCHCWSWRALVDFYRNHTIFFARCGRVCMFQNPLYFVSSLTKYTL
jgi:hypothetical protein